MAWAALGKAALGAVKGGAKKIAADRLLNRKKNVKNRREKVQESMGGGGEPGKGGALAIRPTTSLMPLDPTGVSGGSGGGNTAEEIASSISTKIIRVEKLLAGSLAIKEKIREDARIAREKAKDKKQEAALEKSKPKDAKKGPKLNLPGKSLIEKILGFFGTVILGWIAVRLVKWLPQITAFVQRLAPFVDGFIDFAGMILDGLTRFIDFSYRLYDAATGWIKQQLGEEGAKKFDIFMGNLKKLIQGFLVWKIIGEKIFKAIISSIRNVWKTVTQAIRTIWVKLRRLMGRKARIFFKKLASRIGAGARSGMQWAGNIARRGISRVGGLLSRGGGALARTGAGQAVARVGGWATKIFGKAAGVIAPALKAATPAVKGFARRIPILGPIIVAIVSLMSGEGIGQALFKSVGAALGGALGTFIPIPILGTLIGETIGMFIGDLLYYTIIERNPKKAFGMLKGALTKIFSAGKAVAEWLGGGIKRYIENFLKDTAIEIPEGGGRHTAMTLVAKTLGLFDWLKGLGYVNAEGRVSKFPNLLQLMNPFKTIPIAIKSFFPPGGEESGSTGSENEVKSGDTGGDDKSKGLEKQEKALISANQKKGYAGVMEEIESYAPYEDISASTTVSVSTPSSGQSPSGGGDSSRIITVGGGGDNWKADAFESLDFYG